jgi:hypothetical protein
VSDSHFATLLAEIGQMLGIAGLVPSEGGICQLAFDGRHVVQIIAVDGRGHILISCQVGAVAMDSVQAMLAAQNNFMQVAGGIIACAAPNGRLHLQFSIPRTECRAPALMSAIEVLLNQVEIWEARLVRAESLASNANRDPASLLRSV